MQVGIHELLGHGSGKLYHRDTDDVKWLRTEGVVHPLTGECPIEGPYEGEEPRDSGGDNTRKKPQSPPGIESSATDELRGNENDGNISESTGIIDENTVGTDRKHGDENIEDKDRNPARATTLSTIHSKKPVKK